MGRHSIDIHQLMSGGGSFLNVIDTHGVIGVWTNVSEDSKYGVAVIRNGPNTVGLIAYDSDEWLEEWKEEHPAWEVEPLA